MSDHETIRRTIMRQRETEKRVRAGDALDLVEEIHRLEDKWGDLFVALVDAEKRLRGAGMLGGADDPVTAAIEKARNT